MEMKSGGALGGRKGEGEWSEGGKGGEGEVR